MSIVNILNMNFSKTFSRSPEDSRSMLEDLGRQEKAAVENAFQTQIIEENR